jgi:cytochrome c
MKNRVIAILLIVFVATVAFFVLAGKPHQDVAQPAPADPPMLKPGAITSESIPEISDMSSPMPLGLKGDPDKGRIFFMGNCFTCHGVKGDGEGPRAYFITPPPRDFLLEASRKKLNRPVLFEAITNGRLGTNMPAWGKVLSNQEIADVAEFVFENFIHSSKETGNEGK